MSSRFANPTFLRRLKDIFQRCFQSVFYHCLENCLAKMSKSCFCKMSYIPLYEMSFRQPCKISSRFANSTSFRRLKDILPKYLEWLHKTTLRCLLADWVQYHKEAIDHFCGCSISYHLWIWKKNKSKCQNQTK